MKRIVIFLIILLIIISCTTTGGSTPAAKEEPVAEEVLMDQNVVHDNVNPVGTWEGKLDVGAAQLRMVFHIEKDETGSLSAAIDSPDQGAFGISVAKVLVEGIKVVLVIPAVAVEWEGFLEENMLKGTWKQGGQIFPLDLVLLEEPIDYSRPQDPVEPYPYQVTDITFENPEAGITLAGTLTYPEGGGPVPAVILISGSGPQNRDEELMGHRPFLVIADHFTRAGIAVLRFDDRGIGESTGDFTTATSEDFVTDVNAAAAYLKTQEHVMVAKLGLAGHSEGGLIAPMAAAGSEDIDFIILLAGPGFNGEIILLQQNEAIMRATGLDETTISQAIEVNTELYKIAKSVENREEAMTKMKVILAPFTTNEEEAQMQIDQLLNPWFRFFLSHDPVPVLEQLTLPVLAVNGSLDLQVLSKENLGSIDQALTRAGNTQYEIKEFEGKNHLFQTATTGLMQEYSTISETFSPEVLEYITTWINGLE